MSRHVAALRSSPARRCLQARAGFDSHVARRSAGRRRVRHAVCTPMQGQWAAVMRPKSRGEHMKISSPHTLGVTFQNPTPDVVTATAEDLTTKTMLVGQVSGNVQDGWLIYDRLGDTQFDPIEITAWKSIHDYSGDFPPNWTTQTNGRTFTITGPASQSNSWNSVDFQLDLRPDGSSDPDRLDPTIKNENPPGGGTPLTRK